MAPVEGKRVLLTGASGAIGGEVARRLASRGARLALSGRRVAALDALADELVGSPAARPLVLPADLGRRGEAAALGERAIEGLGGLDIVINNAGASVQGLSWIVGDRDEAREVLETNFWSPLALAAAVGPSLVERGDGTIVIVGSMARVSPFPHLGHYAASRAAVASAADILRLELDHYSVRVVEVALGPVDTPSSQENRVLAGADRWLDGRPGLGRLTSAAATIVAAAEGGPGGVVFYPRVLRWAHRFPGLGRRYTRRTARHADLTDRTVRFGGSTGHDTLTAVRDEWDRQPR